MLSKLRKIKFTILVVSFFSTSNNNSLQAQKSVTSIQTGILGIWTQHERVVANTITLRLEMGAEPAIAGNGITNEKSFRWMPVGTVEPRLYYNLKTRNRKGFNTSNYAANFVSLKTSYNPGWAIYSNEVLPEKQSNYSIIPTYGLKRNINKYFFYEVGIGFGIRQFIKTNSVPARSEGASNVLLRIGYYI